jgi:hypothetical protein
VRSGASATASSFVRVDTARSAELGTFEALRLTLPPAGIEYSVGGGRHFQRALYRTVFAVGSGKRAFSTVPGLEG